MLSRMEKPRSLHYFSLTFFIDDIFETLTFTFKLKLIVISKDACVLIFVSIHPPP